MHSCCISKKLRLKVGEWRHEHEVMMWLADCSFAPQSQVSVHAIPHLCIVARKKAVTSFLGY